MRLKVLQIPETLRLTCQLWPDDSPGMHAREYFEREPDAAPRIQRDGWYRLGAESWMEFEGEAWTAPVAAFDAAMRECAVQPLNVVDHEMLLQVSTRFPALRQTVAAMLDADTERRKTRDVGVRTMRHFMGD